MQLQIEHLPNLNVINFYIKGLLEYSALLLDVDNPQNPRFVQNIFEYAGGGHFLITPDLIAFKYPEDKNDVESLKLLIMAELEDFLDCPQNLSNIKGEESVLFLAQAVADSYIRPTLNRDKGDVEISEFKDGVLSLKFIGHCAGCPFAQNTLNNVIAKAFNRFIPLIKEIRLVE